jgi:hypothetical protein
LRVNADALNFHFNHFHNNSKKRRSAARKNTCGEIMRTSSAFEASPNLSLKREFKTRNKDGRQSGVLPLQTSSSPATLCRTALAVKINAAAQRGVYSDLQLHFACQTPSSFWANLSFDNLSFREVSVKSNFRPLKNYPLVVAVLGFVVLGFAVCAAQAQAAKPPTLSFDLVAAARRNGSKSAAQVMKARFHIRGERVRVESELAGQPLVVLLARPYVYRLLPNSKTGVRYKSNSVVPEFNALGAHWKDLLQQPQKLRAQLKKQGAKKIGVSTLNGVKVDVYSASHWNGQPRKIKLWLRQSDALPLRAQTETSGAQITMNWKNYRRGHALSSSLFTVPKDYRIRDGQAR